MTPPDSGRFARRWNEWRHTVTARRILVGVLASVATVVLLLPFWPFLTADFWPTVVDLGGHRVPMRAWGSWLAEGRTIGWDHSWFNGYPIYQFYFPGGWFIWQLFNVVLPEATAYRLMISCSVPRHWSWRCGGSARTWGLTLTRSGVLGACFCCRAHRPSPRGLVSVTVAAGLYAHNWSVVFGLCYLAALNKSGRRWGLCPLVGFLSLTAAFLSHPYPAGFIGAASLLLLGRVGWRTFVKGTLLVAGLTAWWWLPFVTHLDLAYLDMARWPAQWDAVLMFPTAFRLVGVTGSTDGALLVAYVAGGVAVLVLAAAGAYRLARTVPDRRVLYPFVAMMALPLVNRLARTLNIADGLAEFVGFQGSRLFFIWWIAVPSLAVYAVVDLARDTIPKLRTVRPATFAAGVSLPLVSAAALLTLTVPAVYGLMTLNTDARYTIPPASIGAQTETATWYAATVFVAHGLRRESSATATPALFYVLASDTGRNVHGLHRESSATARFLAAVPLPEWLHKTQLYDPNVPSPTATRTTWPVPQLQTFGTDLMWEPPTTPERAFPGAPVASRFALLDVPPPPAAWPLVWISPAATSYREFLNRSLVAFGSWDSTDDVTIPVWADPPTGHTSDIARTVVVDWSDDRYVRFHADQPGLYYAPSSWHPNWTLTTEGTGPWPAGPNQMIVWADTAGLVELVWGKHWTESAGQAVSAVTLLFRCSSGLAVRSQTPGSRCDRGATVGVRCPVTV